MRLTGEWQLKNCGIARPKSGAWTWTQPPIVSTQSLFTLPTLLAKRRVGHNCRKRFVALKPRFELSKTRSWTKSRLKAVAAISPCSALSADPSPFPGLRPSMQAEVLRSRQTSRRSDRWVPLRWLPSGTRKESYRQM